jgi:trimeric autotransporter adhesin
MAWDMQESVEPGGTDPIVEAPPAAPPRSRRSLLVAALGGVGGAIASALGRPAATEAAAGSALILGQTNSAGTSATRLTTTSSGGAFWMTQSGSGSGVRGEATVGTGGIFLTAAPNHYGLIGQHTGSAGSGAAVEALGGANTGLFATTASNGKWAILATNTGSPGGLGAIQANGGAHNGVVALTSDNSSYALAGTQNGSTGVAIAGFSLGGPALKGLASNSGDGIQGISSSGRGVYGSSSNGYGMVATGVTGIVSTGTSEFGAGVDGSGEGTSGHGVVGSITQDSSTASGVYGASAGTSSYAGYFVGNVSITGTIAKGGGAFRIDHPLDPANRVLQHSFVESPDMLNIYNGVVTANAKGEATVGLPAWFMALNRDYRYSLTPIGAFAPLFVKSKVSDGRFTIAGAKPGQEVSWQVTGIRQDPWANANRIEVELDKPAGQRGQYLHPVEHGQPATRGVDAPMARWLEDRKERAGLGDANR